MLHEGESRITQRKMKKGDTDEKGRRSESMQKTAPALRVIKTKAYIPKGRRDNEKGDSIF